MTPLAAILAASDIARANIMMFVRLFHRIVCGSMRSIDESIEELLLLLVMMARLFVRSTVHSNILEEANVAIF